jgi:hypothetical protein
MRNYRRISREALRRDTRVQRCAIEIDKVDMRIGAEQRVKLQIITVAGTQDTKPRS